MYTIKEVSQLTGFSIPTIRYYDKEGLIPILKRNSSGIREFTDIDVEWLKLICCLKDSGMSIQDLRKFMELCLKGKQTCEERKELLLEHRKKLVREIEKLQNSLELVDYKIENYKTIGIFHIDQ